jgi:hypothetical protein
MIKNKKDDAEQRINNDIIENKVFASVLINVGGGHSSNVASLHLKTNAQATPKISKKIDSQLLCTFT